MRKEQLLNIYEDNGLYGAKDQNGQIVITAQYTEMYQFSCGLSLVRNEGVSKAQKRPQYKSKLATLVKYT